MGGGYGRVGDSVPISLRGAAEHNKPPAEHSGRGGTAAATLWPCDMMSHALHIIVVHLARSSLSVSKASSLRFLFLVFPYRSCALFYFLSLAAAPLA